jgi:hypothetical protein
MNIRKIMVQTNELNREKINKTLNQTECFD